MEEKFAVIATSYARVDDAVADFGAVRDFFAARSDLDMYDAAVITKDGHGEVHIVSNREEAAAAGIARLAGGLAIGAAVAIFPVIALGAGLFVGGAGAVQPWAPSAGMSPAG